MKKVQTKTAKEEVFDELKVFSDLSTLFASTLELQQTLDETIKLVSHLTKGDACFLYLQDLATHDLVLSASKTPHPQEIGRLRIKIGEGITGWVAKHHKPVAIAKNAHSDPRFIGALPEDRYEAFLSVPVMIKANVVGVINVQHKRPKTFSPRMINVLATIGRQVGGALETARLYDETRRRAKALEALTAVSHAVTEDRYPEEIMQLIVNMTAQMLGSNICSIMLLDDKAQDLRIVASQSLDPGYRGKPPVKLHGSISGKAVLSKKPIQVNDVRKESSYQFRDLAIKQGLVSLLSVPMMYKDKALGLINIYKPVEHIFTEDEVSFSQGVANQCAAAIENTRLLSEKLAAQEALEARKLIERAKGILMQQKRVTEPEAFREIQRQSMDRRKTMKEISEAIILAHEMVQ